MIRVQAFSLIAVLAAPAMANASPGKAEALTTFAKAASFEGTILVGDGKTVEAEIAAGPNNRIGERLPWASITKQIVATLIMQNVAKGRIALDSPASTYIPALGEGPNPAPTVRQLLQHRSGLRNANDTPKDGDTPSFYTSGPTGMAWCSKERGAPSGNWAYNNCDFVALAAIVEAVEKRPLATILKRNITGPLKMRQTRLVAEVEGPRAFDGADQGYAQMFSRLAGAGGLAGTARDLWAFNKALLSGKLLPADQRREMWKGVPELGYMALGQWSFEVPVKGCAKPVAIIERRGSWGRYQSRNLILPDLGKIVIVLSKKGEADFNFGEIWQGSGFSHDLLALAACT
jgi:D-alanyl-D-alanine carboxypeptidase